MTQPSSDPKHGPSRENIARMEIGITDVSTPVKWTLTFFFLALITTVPLLDQIAAYRGESRRLPVAGASRIAGALKLWTEARETKGLYESAAAINAEMLRRIQTYEHDLEDSSVFAGRLLPVMQGAMVGRLHAGSESAYVGRNGWLFFRPDLDYITGPGFLDLKELKARTSDETHSPFQPDPLPAIIDFHEELAARGIELVVVPVPVKSMIYPEQFSSRYEGESALQNPSYADFLAGLGKAGVRYFDPTDVLMQAKQAGSPLYLATDTHWSPRGLEVASRALAQFLMYSGIYAPDQRIAYSRMHSDIHNSGDIAVMLKLPESQSKFPPETATIAQVTDARGVPWRASEASEILLLGDSFANIFSLAGMGWGTNAGLAEQLSAELGAPLDTILINDAGAHVTREQLSRELRQGNDRLAGKKLVIWEFAMRELASGDWKLLDYDFAAPTAPSDNQFTSAHLSGTIAALTRPPRPGFVPYKDCIVALHITNVREPSGRAPREAVVFVWGMRDGVWTDWARAEVGDSFNADVTPWGSVEPRYGSYNRVELSDDELLSLEILWAVSSEYAPVSTRSTQAPASEQLEVTATVGSTQSLADIVATIESTKANVWVGIDGWLYLSGELRHLSVGPFWGDHAKAVSRAENPEFADPLDAIVDFHDQLKNAGIELILLPVPPKAVIYPDTVAPGFVGDGLDMHLQSFYQDLRNRGVNVLDLTQTFRERSAEGGALLYCKQDSHWTSAACAIAAVAIARQLQNHELALNNSALQTTVSEETIQIEGDLWRMLGDAQRPRETIHLYRVADTTSKEPIPSERESAVLLLGDSHTLVFSDGADLFAANAGLRDHLAHSLRIPLDVVGVRGSGSTPARMNLLRRRDNLAGKKVVVWCFAAREFTESSSGWRILPIIKQP